MNKRGEPSRGELAIIKYGAGYRAGFKAGTEAMRMSDPYNSGGTDHPEHPWNHEPTPPAAPSQGERKHKEPSRNPVAYRQRAPEQPSPQTPAETEIDIAARARSMASRLASGVPIAALDVGTMLLMASTRIADLERAAVPREPTEAMLDAGIKAMHDYLKHDGNHAEHIFQAMYDAAQPPSIVDLARAALSAAPVEGET